MHRITKYIHSLLGSQLYGSQVAAHHFESGMKPQLLPLPAALGASVRQVLAHLGIDRLYSHQIEALKALGQGKHIVTATPTASGKTLIYNIPVFEAVARDANSRALYIFPLKALAHDQLKTIRQWSAATDAIEMAAEVYDGDTSAYRRKKIRQKPPHVLLTNPEMVHLALLPFHHLWHEFFSCLRLVVIDEVHTYRGLLGSHMAQLIRRLRRVCSAYGAEPSFILTSATLANPGELAAQLTGLPVHTIKKNGGARGNRHMVMVNPADSPTHYTIMLLKAAMARQLRTIVYTRSRKMAELIALWAQQTKARTSGPMSERVSVYRAGLLPEQRRDIESRLQSGRLLTVVSTSALELGIDIGDLELCILVGYPGSMISTWQRSGRVGRKGQDSALILVAAEDALDQYFIQHPEAFFHGTSEAAVVNPYNPVVLEKHLVCAAAEMPIDPQYPWFRQPQVASCLARLEQQGELLRGSDGRTLITHKRRPHMDVNLRGSGRQWRILNASGRNAIGEIDAFRVYRDTHPGAIYLHQGLTYLVDELDEPAKTVRAHAVQVDYYTRVRSDSEVSIVETESSKKTNKTKTYFGKVKVTDKVIGYERIQTGTGRSIMQADLDLPPIIFETEAIWFEVPGAICSAARKKGFDLMGALHAAEHAAISIMPLLVVADRNDLGGLSTPFHPQTGGAVIFIFDGIPGGAGLSRLAYANARKLFERTGECIRLCPCDTGCPACVHSPKCGSGNHPIDKAGALFILEQLLES